MNETNITLLVITFIVAVGLLLLLGGGAMTGSTLSGGMMDGIGWMWIPTLLILGLGAQLAWVIFAQKK